MIPASDEPFATLLRIQEASFARASEATHRAFPPERHMDAGMLEAFLRTNTTGVLATVRPDGRPHAAPVGFAVTGPRFVIASLLDAARVRNVRANPHASLVVTLGAGTAHAAVIAEGTARIVAPLEATLEMRAPFRDATDALPAWIGAFVVVSPERLLTYAAPAFEP